MINWTKVEDRLPSKDGEYRVLAIWPDKSDPYKRIFESEPKPGFAGFHDGKWYTSWWKEKIVAWAEIDKETSAALAKLSGFRMI